MLKLIKLSMFPILKIDGIKILSLNTEHTMFPDDSNIKDTRKEFFVIWSIKKQ